MRIPFFVQEFTDEMEEAAVDALRNESFVGCLLYTSPSPRD